MNYYPNTEELPMTRKAYNMDECQIVRLEELSPVAMIELNNMPILELTQEEFEDNDGFFGDLKIANHNQYFILQIENRFAFVDTQGYSYCRYAVEIEPGF